MNYTKPELRPLGEAMVAIQSSVSKGNPITLDMPQDQPATTSAYEADE